MPFFISGPTLNQAAFLFLFLLSVFGSSQLLLRLVVAQIRFGFGWSERYDFVKKITSEKSKWLARSYLIFAEKWIDLAIEMDRPREEEEEEFRFFFCYTSPRKIDLLLWMNSTLVLFCVLISELLNLFALLPSMVNFHPRPGSHTHKYDRQTLTTTPHPANCCGCCCCCSRRVQGDTF